MADIAIPAGATAAGSAFEEGRPAQRTIIGSRGDLRRIAGLMRRIAPDREAIVAKILSWSKTDIASVSENVGLLK